MNQYEDLMSEEFVEVRDYYKIMERNLMPLFNEALFE
jgi:hypothetical protein